MTWFFSLRYILTLQDKHPELLYQGLFWFKDLTVQDPYCFLPILSAVLSYFNISVSIVNLKMSMNINSNPNPVMAKYGKYFKYFPFLSLPITVFFPSGLVLYWCSMAFLQLVFSLALKNKTYKHLLGFPEFLPGTIIDKMVKKLYLEPKTGTECHQGRHCRPNQRFNNRHKKVGQTSFL